MLMYPVNSNFTASLYDDDIYNANGDASFQRFPTSFGDWDINPCVSSALASNATEALNDHGVTQTSWLRLLKVVLMGYKIVVYGCYYT